VLIAFLPAAVVGALAHDFIKSVLFNVWIVCFTLIVGGAILLWVDRMQLNTRYHDATKLTLPMYFIIGLAQCVSMIPGVSRAGATIVSAMLLGADRRSSAEFSFWLAMPTMAGAFAYDLYKSHAQMTSGNTILVAFGFAHNLKKLASIERQAAFFRGFARDFSANSDLEVGRRKLELVPLRLD